MIREVATLHAGSEPSAISYTLGITEHSHGVDNVKSPANPAMLTGHIVGALESSEFPIEEDYFLTETARMADVAPPAARLAFTPVMRLGGGAVTTIRKAEPAFPTSTVHIPDGSVRVLQAVVVRYGEATGVIGPPSKPEMDPGDQDSTGTSIKKPE